MDKSFKITSLKRTSLDLEIKTDSSRQNQSVFGK